MPYRAEQLRKGFVMVQLVCHPVAMLSIDKFYNAVCNTLLYIFEQTFFMVEIRISWTKIYMYRYLKNYKILSLNFLEGSLEDAVLTIPGSQ